MSRGGGDSRVALEPGRWMLVVADNVRHEQSEARTGSGIAFGAFRLEGGLGILLWDPSEKQTLCRLIGLDALPERWAPSRVRWGY